MQYVALVTVSQCVVFCDAYYINVYTHTRPYSLLISKSSFLPHLQCTMRQRELLIVLFDNNEV